LEMASAPLPQPALLLRQPPPAEPHLSLLLRVALFRILVEVDSLSLLMRYCLAQES